MWQLMEERKVVERRSWQSIKERFRRNILKRLEAFDLSEEPKQQLRQGGKGVKRRGGRGQSGSHLASDHFFDTYKTTDDMLDRVKY